MPDPSRDAQWYERRKRALVMASLGRAQYAYAFEPACGCGALTVALAQRCRRVLALDQDHASLHIARKATSQAPNVSCRGGVLPRQWPAGTFDLIVLSEWLYYLDVGQRDVVAARSRDALRADGDIVACHWRHPVPECGESAVSIHARLGASLGLPLSTAIDDEDFILHRWSNAPLTIAQAEGLCP